MSIEAQTYLRTAIEVFPIKVVTRFRSRNVLYHNLVDFQVRQTADFAHIGMVKPHVARGDAMCGRGPVEHQTAEAIHGQPRIRPAAISHQELREVTVVATSTLKAANIRKITCDAEKQIYPQKINTKFKHKKDYKHLLNLMSSPINLIRFSTSAARSSRAIFGSVPAVAAS